MVNGCYDEEQPDATRPLLELARDGVGRGEELEENDEICGAVVSLRSKVDRIQVWTRSKDDVEKLNGIGKRLVKLLDVSEVDNIGLEFQVRAPAS